MFVIAFEYLNKDKRMTRSSIRGKNNIWTDVGFIFVKCLNEKDQVLVGISQLSMISFTTWDIHKINVHVVKVMHYKLSEAILSIFYVDWLLPSCCCKIPYVCVGMVPSSEGVGMLAQSSLVFLYNGLTLIRLLALAGTSIFDLRMQVRFMPFLEALDLFTHNRYRDPCSVEVCQVVCSRYARWYVALSFALITTLSWRFPATVRKPDGMGKVVDVQHVHMYIRKCI